MVLPPSSATGYVAAFVSCVAFGSFCVPMKSEAIRAVNMDPLVFQSYKTIVCFLTSFLVLFLGVERLTFSAWGIVSGLFWVPNGVAFTTSVQTAGLAISGATGASIIVLVSFVWGIFIFHERVRSLASACCAIGFMIVGICGMSFFSSPQLAENNKDCSYLGMSCIWDVTKSQSIQVEEDEEESSSEDSGSEDEMMDTERGSASLTRTSLSYPETSQRVSAVKKSKLYVFDKSRLNAVETQLVEKDDKEDDILNGKKVATGGSHAIVSAMTQYIRRNHGINLSIRQMGLVVCVLGAAWGGSAMVPLTLAGEETQGLGYVFSFAVGAVLTNSILWMVRYYHAYAVLCGCDCRAAWQAMPSFHLSAALLPCATSGVLWSIGNMGSMVSVTHLGEGVGYSLCQSSILITGCWGIFWFREITNKASIQGWLASACLAIAGILLLSYNHLPPDPEMVLKG